MRPLTAAQRALLEADTFATHVRVLIEDPDGQLVSIDDAEGGDWFVSARWDENIDQPVSAATIELARDAGDALSLSPWREDSPLNRNAAGEYAPRIDVGRRVAIEVATTASWEVPSAGSWVRVWEGVIDDVRAARDPIVLSCRDLGGELVDRQIETRHTYGSAEGVPVETVMQQILDDHAAGITLHVPSSPGQMITEYAPWEVSVMDALQRLAASIGWDLRYRWVEAESEFRLTFSEPDRAKTDPDYTFTPDLYLDIRTLDAAIADVRNVIEVVYADKESGTVKRVQVKDDESIERYGRRFARFTEGPDSTIDSEEEALAFADAALQDLADPLATHSIENLFWWPAELGDLYEYSPNGVHYNTPQRFAVVRIQHELRPDHHQTIIDARGRPAGRYLTWLVMATPASTTAGSASIQVDPTQEGSTGKLRLRITDPDLTIVAVQFQRRKGAELFDGDWSDVWDTAQGTPGTDAVLLREAEVELVKGHNSEIKWRALYRDGAGNLLESGGSHTFDSDTRADVTGAQVTFSAQGTIVVSATGDEDAVALYVTAAAGEEPPDPTAEAHDGHIEARTGTVDTGVPCAPGEEAHVKVRGVNAAGELGPVWGPTTVWREDPGDPASDPHLTLIQTRWVYGPVLGVTERGLEVELEFSDRVERIEFVAGPLEDPSPTDPVQTKYSLDVSTAGGYRLELLKKDDGAGHPTGDPLVWPPEYSVDTQLQIRAYDPDDELLSQRIVTVRDVATPVVGGGTGRTDVPTGALLVGAGAGPLQALVGSSANEVVTWSTAGHTWAARALSFADVTGDLSWSRLTNHPSILAGAGLTGGGTLAQSRTLNVGAGTGISVSADAVSFDQSWGDARYAAKVHGHGIADIVGPDMEIVVGGGVGGLKTIAHPAPGGSRWFLYATGDQLNRQYGWAASVLSGSHHPGQGLAGQSFSGETTVTWDVRLSSGLGNEPGLQFDASGALQVNFGSEAYQVPRGNHSLTDHPGALPWARLSGAPVAPATQGAQVVGDYMWARWHAVASGGGGLYHAGYGIHLYGQDADYWAVNSGFGMIFRSGVGGTIRGYLGHGGGANFGLLSSDGNWKVAVHNGGVNLYGSVAAQSSMSVGGGLTVSGSLQVAGLPVPGIIVQQSMPSTSYPPGTLWLQI